MAAQTLKTLCSLVVRSENEIFSVCKTYSHCLFRKKTRNVLNFQKIAAYRAAVLHEISAPLVIEDVAVSTQLKNSEVSRNYQSHHLVPIKYSAYLQVRVEVYTCGVNASDILICNGQYGVKQKMPFVPGFEVCGEVIEIGPLVKNFSKGDRVIGLKKDGYAGFAEECIVLEQDLWNVPQAMTFEIGASLIDTYGTALLGLHRRAEVKADDTVLVTAAAGGLGLAAVDLAANVYKAKVGNMLHCYS